MEGNQFRLKLFTRQCDTVFLKPITNETVFKTIENLIKAVDLLHKKKIFCLDLKV